MAAPAQVPRHAPTDHFRPLPHDLQCEASILGGIILRDRQALADLAELEIEDFYHHPHRVVFEAMRNLEARNLPIDVTMLEAELKLKGKSDSVGGVAFLGELALRVPTPDNVRHYRDIVLQLAKNRRAILKLNDAAERARNWQHDPSDLIAEITGDLQRFDTDRPVGEQTKEQRARWTVDYDAFLGNDEPDDDDAIDWVMRDLIPRGEPFLWGGPMKGGKTWAAMDLLVAIALGEKWLGAFDNTWGGPARVLGVLLEDNHRRTRKRLWELCRSRGTNPHDVRLRQNLKISRAPLRLPDAADQKRFVAELKEWKPAVVIVDNLTRVFVGDPNSTRDAASFARAWTEICEETGCALGFLHHTKKPGGGDQKAVDPFNELRGSNDFGACARNIIVTTPIRNESDERLSEVRMRGNLDLRRDGFVMGFERKQLLDRWQARLVDRGDISDVKDEVAKQQKNTKQEKRKAALVEETQQRRARAMFIAKAEGGVSGMRLATELGLKSSRGTVAETLNALVRDGELRPDRVRGYVLADAHIQSDLLDGEK